MQAEEGGDHVDVPLRPQPPGRRELPGLCVEVEPIAGLDLDGRDALGDQGVEPWQGGVALTVETMPPPARAISS